MTIKTILKSRIFRLTLFLVLSVFLIDYTQPKGKILGQRVEAVGNLNFVYPNDPGGPVFTVTNMLPGDCVSEIITAENSATSQSRIAVRSQDEIDLDLLSSQLEISISELGSDIYGGTLGTKTVGDFFTDSDGLNGIELSTLAGNGATTDYTFEVCFDTSAGNEYQNTQTIFDLAFGEIIVPIELPEVCKDLEGIVTQEIVGTSGNDRIRGTGASELIRGLGGNDRIDGGGGHDCIIGGAGNDRLDGGSGDDIVTGNAGLDEIDGGSGDDLVKGGAHSDELDGGTGEDVVEGNGGDDEIDGSRGIDQIFGGAGNDEIDGGRDNDVIRGQGGGDEIKGGSGNDEIYGQGGNDTLRGGSGDDLLDGGAATDSANGNSGTDTCIAETTNRCEL